MIAAIMRAVKVVQIIVVIVVRGVNVRPNPRTRHEPDTGFFGLGLGLNGFGS